MASERLPWWVRWRCWRGKHRAADPQIEVVQQRDLNGRPIPALTLRCSRCTRWWPAAIYADPRDSR